MRVRVPTAYRNARCTLHDARGVLICQEKTAGSSAVLRVDKLAAGSYVLRVHRAGTTPLIRPIVLGR